MSLAFKKFCSDVVECFGPNYKTTSFVINVDVTVPRWTISANPNGVPLGVIRGMLNVVFMHYESYEFHRIAFRNNKYECALRPVAPPSFPAFSTVSAGASGSSGEYILTDAQGQKFLATKLESSSAPAQPTQAFFSQSLSKHTTKSTNSVSTKDMRAGTFSRAAFDKTVGTSRSSVKGKSPVSSSRSERAGDVVKSKTVTFTENTVPSTKVSSSTQTSTAMDDRQYASSAVPAVASSTVPAVATGYPVFSSSNWFVNGNPPVNSTTSSFPSSTVSSPTLPLMPSYPEVSLRPLAPHSSYVPLMVGGATVGPTYPSSHYMSSYASQPPFDFSACGTHVTAAPSTLAVPVGSAPVTSATVTYGHSSSSVTPYPAQHHVSQSLPVSAPASSSSQTVSTSENVNAGYSSKRKQLDAEKAEHERLFRFLHSYDYKPNFSFGLAPNEERNRLQRIEFMREVIATFKRTGVLPEDKRYDGSRDVRTKSRHVIAHTIDFPKLPVLTLPTTTAPLPVMDSVAALNAIQVPKPASVASLSSDDDDNVRVIIDEPVTSAAAPTAASLSWAQEMASVDSQIAVSTAQSTTAVSTVSTVSLPSSTVSTVAACSPSVTFAVSSVPEVSAHVVDSSLRATEVAATAAAVSSVTPSSEVASEVIVTASSVAEVVSVAPVQSSAGAVLSSTTPATPMPGTSTAVIADTTPALLFQADQPVLPSFVTDEATQEELMERSGLLAAEVHSEVVDFVNRIKSQPVSDSQKFLEFCEHLKQSAHVYAQQQNMVKSNVFTFLVERMNKEYKNNTEFSVIVSNLSQIVAEHCTAIICAAP